MKGIMTTASDGMRIPNQLIHSCETSFHRVESITIARSIVDSLYSGKRKITCVRIIIIKETEKIKTKPSFFTTIIQLLNKMRRCNK